jgi:hypothetical protein
MQIYKKQADNKIKLSVCKWIFGSILLHDPGFAAFFAVMGIYCAK